MRRSGQVEAARHRGGISIVTLAVLVALCARAGSSVSAPSATTPLRATTPAPPASAAVLRDLEAFARLYGYVRWFHASDEAAAVDWDRMAVLGAERSSGAADDAALGRTLEALFVPVAPSLRVYREGEVPSPLAAPPAPSSRWKTIAWQHLGLGQGRTGYRSERTNRPPSANAAASSFGTIMQQVPADDLRGRRVRLRAAVRADVTGAGNQGQLWLRVDRRGGQQGFFDNMAD